MMSAASLRTSLLTLASVRLRAVVLAMRATLPTTTAFATWRISAWSREGPRDVHRMPGNVVDKSEKLPQPLMRECEPLHVGRIFEEYIPPIGIDIRAP